MDPSTWTGPDEWHDGLRVIVMIISFWSLIKMIRLYRAHGDDWNIKTKDYWYALFAWSVAGVVQPLQGILLDRPLTPAFVVITAAVLVTGKGLHRKGAWGGFDD